MTIGCTKKLLDFLKVQPQSAEAPVDPLFSWTANLIILNRHKVLVATNSATRCRFVLYGLTAKNIAKLPEMMLQGVRAMLQSEYIAPEIIEKYLDELGRELTITKTSSRSDTSCCNNACRRVETFADIFDDDSIFQERFLPWINDDLTREGNSDHYWFLYERLITALTDRYGSPVQSAHVAELDVRLDLNTTCRRTLIVPSNINFYQLHRILQHAFEWHDEHLHQFVLSEGGNGQPMTVIQPDYGEEDDIRAAMGMIESFDSTEITVREVFEAKKRIVYEYDFGDEWIHTVKLVRFIDNCTTPYPHCTKAVGDAPMEDSGGRYGFAEKMRILNDPEHPDYEEVSEWVKGSWWSPLDIAKIDRMIRQEHRYCIPTQYD